MKKLPLRGVLLQAYAATSGAGAAAGVGSAAGVAGVSTGSGAGATGAVVIGSMCILLVG